MLTSLVVQIEALEDGEIRGGSGRAVHGFWYRHWEKVDAATADALHAENGVLPFSLSPLMGLPRPYKGVIRFGRGAQAWFRAAALTAQLSEKMETLWAQQLPDEITLADVRWRVVGLPAEHPWRRRIRYQDLAAQRLFNNHPPKRWNLAFETPVTFNSGGGYLPFPLPDALVASWMRRWQAFAPLALPDALPERARAALVVSSYQMRSVAVRHAERVHPGGVGRYTLRAAKMLPSERAQVDLLANYAFFCGSGYKTAQGMGMTRLLP